MSIAKAVAALSLSLGACGSGLAAQSMPASITNPAVVGMVRLGVPDAAIVAAIGVGPVNFDLAPTALVTLHQGGVDATVLEAMMRAAKTPPGGAPPAAGTGLTASGTAPVVAKPAIVPKPDPAAARAALAKLMSARKPLVSVIVSQPPSAADAAALAALTQQHAAAQAGPSGPGGPSPGPAAAVRLGTVSTKAAPVRPGASRPVAPAVANAPAMDACMAVNAGPIIQGLAQGSAGGPAVFTQDPKYNPVAVTGCHFGQQQGSAYLKDAAGTKLADLGIPIGGWSDSQIKVTVDPALVDVMDQDNLTLVVVPASGPMVQKAGFKFYAMRREIHVASIPAAVAALAGIVDTNKEAVKAVYSSPYGGLGLSLVAQGETPSSTIAAIDQGMTAGADRNDWYRFGGGTDTFDFSLLKPGFVVTRFQIDKQNLEYCTSNGNLIGGDLTHYSDGQWKAGFDAGQRRLVVNFAEVHCHQTNGSDSSNSTYALDVWVVGPALSPQNSPWQGAGH